jgi:hemolysin activation/secretion protein
LTRIFATTVGAAALVFAPQAYGQEVGPTREELNLPTPAAKPPSTDVQIRSGGAMQAGPCPLSESDLKATITQVEFRGPGGAELPPELSQALAGIQPAAGEQPITQVCQLRDEAQARLQAARYLASVQIPQQRIGDGVLRLEVVWGHITEVHVRGEAGAYESLLKARIEQLKALDPLNEADAERILLLSDEVPGLSVSLALSPANTKPGDLIGDLTITADRFSLVANVQNYNSPYLGRETFFLRGEVYGLTGMGDITSLSLSSTFDFKKQKIAQLRHAMVVDAAGDTLSLTGTLAESRPDLKTLDLRTISEIGTIEFTHPLVRTVTDSLSLSGGFEYVQQRTRTYAGSVSSPLNRDRIPAVFLRLSGQKRDLRLDGSTSSSVAGQIELHRGLDVLGATHAQTFVNGYTPSRFEGSAIATIVRAKVEGEIGVGPIFELGAKANAQWANRPLLNYDEYAIGNFTIGRGYDPGANSGDRAVGFSVEPRANFVVNPDVHGQLYGFYDGVRLWNLDQNTTEKNRYIASVGGGVRASFYRSILVDLTYTHPLDPPLLTGTNIVPPGDRVMFSLTAKLVPFGR